MIKKCLMITMKDNRKFFTSEKNLVSLIEFSKIFDAEISIVKVEKDQIMDLKQITSSICEPPKENQITSYQFLKTPKFMKRTLILKSAYEIRKHIENEFLNGNIVSLKELKEKFDKKSLTCICNHISKTKKNLEIQGHKIKKIAAGKYQILKSNTS